MPIVALAFALWTSISSYAEPAVTLSIRADGQERKFSAADLLRLPQLIALNVPADPAYNGQPRKYQAIAVADLLKEFNVGEDSMILFHCRDGFSGPLSTKALLNKSSQGAVAYIAVENPSEPWPRLSDKNTNSAGPFYLVWKDPQKSSIGREQWPYQLAALEIRPALVKQFPRIDPKSTDARVKAGFEVFVKNCFTCHTLNGDGTSHMGPDLNLPKSPTEYFAEKYLRQLIRDPQQVRRWPESKMKGFTAKDLSDQEMDQLIAYLKHMARHRSP